jgi:hypothetical protein
MSDAHAHADAVEVGRALALQRWSPEVRLRTAVDTVAERAANLDDAQRAKLELALQNGDGQ